MTKTFTGIAVMQLRDRGRLSLDDPIVAYVPELRAVHDPFGPVEAITIRQLMTHSDFREGEARTPGIFDLDTDITVSNGGLNAPLPDMAHSLAFLAGEPGSVRYEEVLKRLSLEEMWVPRIGVNDPADLADASGFLFFVLSRGGKTYVGHGGEQNGFVTHVWVHPPSRTAYAIAFNTDATPGPFRLKLAAWRKPRNPSSAS